MNINYSIQNQIKERVFETKKKYSSDADESEIMAPCEGSQVSEVDFCRCFSSPHVKQTLIPVACGSTDA